MQRGFKLFICAYLTAAGVGDLIADDVHYFLVAEPSGWVIRNDSYVLPLSKLADIQYARKLIIEGPTNNDYIAVARIAGGKDRINRDHLASGKPEWNWHVTEFIAYSETVPAAYDGSPGLVEEQGLPEGTSRIIGFSGYTVVAELGPALELSITALPTTLVFNWPNLSTNATYNTQGTNLVYTVENNDSLSTTNWVPVAGFTWPTQTNQVTIPAPSTPTACYRVKAELGSPP